MYRFKGIPSTWLQKLHAFIGIGIVHFRPPDVPLRATLQQIRAGSGGCFMGGVGRDLSKWLFLLFHTNLSWNFQMFQKFPCFCWEKNFGRVWMTPHNFDALPYRIMTLKELQSLKWWNKSAIVLSYHPVEQCNAWMPCPITCNMGRWRCLVCVNKLSIADMTAACY